MTTLAERLLLAFAVVIGVVGVVTVVLASRAASSEIRLVMLVGPTGSMEMTDAESLANRLAASYERSGSWDEAAELMDGAAPHMRMMGGVAALAAPDGLIIAGAPSGRLSERERDKALPIRARGRVVGLLAVREVSHMMRPSVDEAVWRVNRAVALAVAAGAALAFGLALLIVATIARPLDRLATAARAVESGDLSARAPMAGPTEVRGVAAAFNHMAESLTAQESRRRAMLSDIAHELRTPLAVLAGQIEALADGIFPPTAENLRPLSVQAAQLTRLVDDLRTLASAEAGQLELQMRPVPVQDVVSELVGSIRPESAARDVTVTCDVPSDMPPLLADPVRLRQVLGNLLSNALRYTSAGGTIGVSVSAEQDGEMARLTITDNGQGISPDDLPHVFERFYRADGSRSRSTGGSGLGLAIVRRLTEAHGGQITITSSVGRGTSVSLLWPSAKNGRAD